MKLFEVSMPNSKGPRLSGNDGLVPDSDLNINGVSLQDNIEYPYYVLEDLFGRPINGENGPEWTLEATWTWDPYDEENDPDDRKVEWKTDPVIIYDKYNQDMNANITWHIGANNKWVTGLVKDYIEKNLHMTGKTR